MESIFMAFLMLLSALTWADLNLQKFCLDKSLNQVLPHPQNCGGFITCLDEPTVQFCEEGFHFDMKGMVCNWPEKVNCQLAARQVEDEKDILKPLLTPFAAFDILTGQVIDPMVGYNPLNVVCRHFGAYFLPNPQNCRSYFFCAYGHIHEHACGTHTLWDYKLQQCVLSHQATCYRFSQEEEKELIIDVDNISMVCYPVNVNSSLAETIHMTTTEYKTALPALIMTTATLTTTPLPTPPTITIISTTTEQPNFSNPFNITCPVKRQSYVAHPYDCSKYFMCIMGTAVMTSCPMGLLWDTAKAYCDISKNVKCFQQKI